jgi:hypothetical protein
MKRFILFSALGASLTIPAYIFAQNDQQQMMMDDAQEAKDDLMDAVEAKQAAKAEEAAGKITKLLSEARKFWVDQKQADVVKMFDETLAIAAEMSNIARSGDMANAKATFDKLNTSCSNCHDTHPENRLKK